MIFGYEENNLLPSGLLPPHQLRINHCYIAIGAGVYHRLWNLTRSAPHITGGTQRLIGIALVSTCVELAGFSPGAKGCAGVRLCATAGQDFLPVGRQVTLPRRL